MELDLCAAGPPTLDDDDDAEMQQKQRMQYSARSYAIMVCFILKSISLFSMRK
jgi:hypothetical protein